MWNDVKQTNSLVLLQRLRRNGASHAQPNSMKGLELVSSEEGRKPGFQQTILRFSCLSCSSFMPWSSMNFMTLKASLKKSFVLTTSYEAQLTNSPEVTCHPSDPFCSPTETINCSQNAQGHMLFHPPGSGDGDANGNHCNAGWYFFLAPYIKW